MTYYELTNNQLTNDELTDQELTQVSGGSLVEIVKHWLRKTSGFQDE
ncbi:MAG: bacteriocin [Prochlorococcus sp.]|jgi:bacteriocin-like protein